MIRLTRRVEFRVTENGKNNNKPTSYNGIVENY